ncbi:MAG: glycosyltransferase [Nitrospinae bacterium]|nr:glycosyltransferase [Nitrospinota bacterium]
MNILMISNTYSPHVGGVARSVEAFASEYRRTGNRVVVVAPEFDGMPDDEEDTIRVPAIQNFNGSDFSVRLPIPGLISSALEDFRPDIVHSHHPFLLGDTALLLSASQNAPLTFTHHTMYEQYTHYVPGDSPALQRFVVELSTGYANLCDMVFAPSESIAEVLRKRGVQSPIEIVPTGVRREALAEGDGDGFRAALNIPRDAFLVGHLGRLAPEKNMDFLSRGVVEFLKSNSNVRFLLIGVGPSLEIVKDHFEKNRLSRRLHVAGILKERELADAYRAMDVFAFASKSETQGMVLTEAMAQGVPVVAIDAPGVREVVVNERNGRLLARENAADFAAALSWVASLPPDKLNAMKRTARETAGTFSIGRTAALALSHYESLLTRKRRDRNAESGPWLSAMRMFEKEWDIWVNRAHAAGAALQDQQSRSSA